MGVQINKQFTYKTIRSTRNQVFNNFRNGGYVDITRTFRFNFHENGDIKREWVGHSDTPVNSDWCWISGYTHDWNGIGHHQRSHFFLVSKEALEEIENLNKHLANDTNKGYFDSRSIYKQTAISDCGGISGGTTANKVEFLRSIFEVRPPLKTSDYSKHFGNFINNYIPGKEKAYFEPTYPINYDYLELTSDDINNTMNVKYTAPIRLFRHFNHQEFLDNGNTDLYLVIPMINEGGDRFRTFYNKELDTNYYNLTYMAFKITDTNGDGDIKFDHIDDIDYIDSFEVNIKFPDKL